MWLPSPTNIFLNDMQEQFAVDCPNEPARKGRTDSGPEWRIRPHPRCNRDCDAGQSACLARVQPDGSLDASGAFFLFGRVGVMLGVGPVACARPCRAASSFDRTSSAPSIYRHAAGAYEKALNTFSAPANSITRACAIFPRGNDRGSVIPDARGNHPLSVAQTQRIRHVPAHTQQDHVQGVVQPFQHPGDARRQCRAWRLWHPGNRVRKPSRSPNSTHDALLRHCQMGMSLPGKDLCQAGTRVCEERHRDDSLRS
jgi:hypothetical protein